MLSRKAIKEFKQIWKEKFNEEISDEEAKRKGLNLLHLFKLIYRPILRQKTGKKQES